MQKNTPAPGGSSTHNKTPKLRLVPPAPHSKTKTKQRAPMLQDWLDPLPRVDANRMLVRHRGTTFYVYVCGDSMTGAGINAGDVLVVDGMFEAQDGDVIAANYDGECVIKRLSNRGDQIVLTPDNPDYKEIAVTNKSRFKIMGKVMWVLRPVAVEARGKRARTPQPPQAKGARPMGKGKYEPSPFMSLKEAAHFFCTSRTSITRSRGEFAKLAHVMVNGRHHITRESAERLAAAMLKRAKSVAGGVDELAQRRRA